ncbi:hypothetical protein K469DRAFT_722406 [Zopfia rhizophila CBS 207.26]|uniref:Hepatocellular carcinoma-associated antigen 59-domain-containing protein n=1 Tax=Zopfia rhizophila CBS 207.26 TaxID=1314779 RepID=A0A6A6EWC4_9PEZI|nr:hypothetical protein K469DRAFT_722406 [Zopfia rhizophila CBS 207.26]
MVAPDGGETPVFRAHKRRKILRVRSTADDDISTGTAAQLPEPSPATISLDPQSAIPPVATSEEPEESGPSLAEIIRKRKQFKRVRSAVDVVNVTRGAAGRRRSEGATAELVKVEQKRLNPFSDRFVAQTGQVVDKDDKQMIAYIEARMAEKRNQQYGPTSSASVSSTSIAAPPAGIKNVDVKVEATRKHPEDRQAAGMGKLQEIDLGPEATARNIQRTEEARMRLESGYTGLEEPQSPGQGRSGKDGRPRRRRPQKRRNSEDLLRDKMVEQVLREAKLDYYEENDEAPLDANGNEAADDVLAEQFRREFLESIESRRKPAPPGGPKGAKEQTQKGPKLGGSRSARAAMRLQEEQAAKEKR